MIDDQVKPRRRTKKLEKQDKKIKNKKSAKKLITLELMKTTLRPNFGGIIETYPKLRLFFYSGGGGRGIPHSICSSYYPAIFTTLLAHSSAMNREIFRGGFVLRLIATATQQMPFRVISIANYLVALEE